jgi:hypothetical protein
MQNVIQPTTIPRAVLFAGEQSVLSEKVSFIQAFVGRRLSGKAPCMGRVASIYIELWPVHMDEMKFHSYAPVGKYRVDGKGIPWQVHAAVGPDCDIILLCVQTSEFCVPSIKSIFISHPYTPPDRWHPIDPPGGRAMSALCDGNVVSTREVKHTSPRTSLAERSGIRRWLDLRISGQINN